LVTDFSFGRLVRAEDSGMDIIISAETAAQLDALDELNSQPPQALIDAALDYAAAVAAGRLVDHCDQTPRSSG
jgi:hypothetical protein